MLYGINPASNGIVWWDRWAQENHNCVVLARSGAGKSYFVKLDVLRSLYHGVQVAVIDPEDEYQRLADAVGGTVVALGAPGVKLNPLDLPAGDHPPRRADPPRPVPAHLHRRPARPATRTRPNAAALDRAILAAYRSAGITADPATHHRPAPLLADLARHSAADGDPGRDRARGPARAVGDRLVQRPVRRAHHRTARTGTWSCGRCGSSPTNCAPPARSWPWTTSGAKSTYPPAADTGRSPPR